MIVSHGGKFGDLVYALPAIQKMGGGDLVLYPNPHTGLTFTAENVAQIRPLLEAQSYIGRVTYSDHPVGLNLDTYRNHWRNYLNISDILHNWLGLPFASRTEPWLVVDPLRIAPVVLSRCPRYRNGNFPWAKVVQKYGKDAVFIGHPDEHRDFCQSFGNVTYYPTSNLLEAARVIAGATLCVMNQSSPRAIAEGLKKAIVQETSTDHDNCHWERPDAWYGYRSDVYLPDLPKPEPTERVDLTIIVISWKRPHLLEATLKSIRSKLTGLSHRLVVVDNETTAETRAVIEAAAVDHLWALDANRGINWPVEHLLGPVLNSEFVCVSDHDIHYGRDFKAYTDFLRDNPDVAFAKGLDSPEHQASGERDYRGEKWILKSTERGGGVIMRSETLRKAFPLPDHLINFDWHLCSMGLPFAVLPGTVAHTGFRESTRADMIGREIPEKYILVDGEIVPHAAA